MIVTDKIYNKLQCHHKQNHSKHNYVHYVIFKVKVSAGKKLAVVAHWKPFDSNFWAVSTMWQF